MNPSFIRIKAGSYRASDVSGRLFQLVERYKSTPKGGYVTVKNAGQFPGFPEEIRVKVDGVAAYEFVSDDEFAEAGVVVRTNSADETVQETDEQVMERIRERFDILDEMTKAATNGDIRAMIVSGPPGVGKSYGVEQIIEKATLFDQIAGKKLRAEVVKGSATALGLYSMLYKYSDPNCVLVFDDCDSILLDDVALNLLKGALDSGKKRKISWLADSNLLRREGIPDSFNFAGSVIFISNINFSKVKGKLKDHLDALQSRCHFIDLTIDSTRDKILRIKQIINDGMLDEYEFDKETVDELVAFIEVNQTKLREISLRTVLKAADLRKAFPAKWRSFAVTSLIKA